ncbi:Oidioi.mRNA.OKI2018_I69.chr2.g4344.t1.cds [Oikopleura dioica]|uniref:Oidioi.mRNA.OKI2018_I69.chr2.g4344.t1.cds n=1 Tax=Oikopleura dioica TaxID=34765 RepID=A0ABN7T3N3_OIKDI|nr:Oidioi.mRNA.OKI2018_I69.chr2.g4344.t1.cds [Oikopleura dioica]
MKIAAAFFALTQATEQDSGFHCWPGNEHAPYCGCQKILRGPEYNMINATCTLTFPDLGNHPFGSATGSDDLQMLTIASSFPLPQQTDLSANTYVFTGFEGLSHENQLDIVYFFRDDRCVDPTNYEWDRFVVNTTTWGDAEVNCVDYGYAYEGPLLGNFNYDIARSHQQYNLPIYGLDNEAIGVVEINAHQVNEPFEVAVRNVSAHHGHGETTHIDCENTFQYQVDANHGGILEYAQFELCEPDLSADDYDYTVPSSWTSQILLA